MANFSNYLEQQLLGVSLLGSSFTAVQTVYAALATSVTSDGDVFTEVTTNIGYGRLPVQWSAPTSPNDWSVVNSATVSYSTASTPWGTITHVGLYDAETIGTGNLLYWGELQTARVIETNDSVSFPAGDLSVRLD